MISVALKYTPDVDRAPIILASGRGNLGMEIKRIAELHKIPTVADEQLAETLSQFPTGKEIPESLYKAVAVVFQFLYTLERKI